MRGQIVKRQGKTGTSWAIRHYDQDGNRHYKTVGRRKVDAEKALSEVLSKVDRGEYKALPDITLKDFADKWLTARAADVRPKTIASYRQHMNNRIVPFFGRRKLRSITTEDVEALKAHMSTEKISPATVGKHLLTLRMMFKTAMAWKYASENPAQFVKRPQHTRPELSVLGPNDVERLIAATDDRHKCLLAAACYTGLRQGELLGLRWGDIQFADNRLYVRRTLQHGKFYEPKSKTSKRTVSIPVSLVETLKEHQARQAIELQENEDELVFPSGAGKRHSAYTVIHQVFEPALKRAGLRKVRFHDLRHSYAAALISAGENPKWVQKQLGHSSIQIILDIYGHLLPDAEREASERLEAVLMPKAATVC